MTSGGKREGKVARGRLPDGYPAFLAGLKERIVQARVSAVRAVNRDLILLYWDIGQAIVEKQNQARWGDSVVERLAADLRTEFPGMRGLSADNLWRMRQFYAEYCAPEFLEQAVPEIGDATGAFLEQPVPELSNEAKRGVTAVPGGRADGSDVVRSMVADVPWGHHIELIKKVRGPAARLYYLQATARFGWSRNVLLNQIKAGAFERAMVEKKAHNFGLALPEHMAEQADEMMKSRYNLEFLGISRAVRERELEDRLVSSLQAFLLELGYGFCFVGRQHRLAVGGKEYFVDLLFYHRFLKALVAFDLKVGSFEPEHAGKMDFYLNLLNDLERGPDDQPSIGIILCAEKDDIEVEYALRTKRNPIGVAEYQLQSRLPAEFRGKLPTARQISDALARDLEEAP